MEILLTGQVSISIAQVRGSGVKKCLGEVGGGCTFPCALKGLNYLVKYALALKDKKNIQIKPWGIHILVTSVFLSRKLPIFQENKTRSLTTVKLETAVSFANCFVSWINLSKIYNI